MRQFEQSSEFRSVYNQYRSAFCNPEYLMNELIEKKIGKKPKSATCIVLRIRDVFLTLKLFLSYRKNDVGCSCSIPDPKFRGFKKHRIPDPDPQLHAKVSYLFKPYRRTAGAVNRLKQ
jgi:hypothetical protein